MNHHSLTPSKVLVKHTLCDRHALEKQRLLGQVDELRYRRQGTTDTSLLTSIEESDNIHEENIKRNNSKAG